MAQEQTAYAGDDIKVLVNVIGSTGTHVAAVINTTTTRLDGLSAAPTVTTVATGIYQIVFSGVTPAPAEGDRYTCKVNGTIAGVAWSEYGIPVKIVADERGTDNVVVPTADITAIKAKTDQLAFTVSNQVDANALTGGGGDDSATIYNYFTASSREDAFKATGFNTVTPDNVSISAILADTNELQTNQGDWLTATGFATVNPDNASILLILADTNELQQNQGDWATATGFNTVAPDNASITAILADTNELQGNQGDWLTATGFATVNPDNASIALILADTNELQGNQGDWLTATGFNTVAPDNASIAAIKATTDQFTFTVSNQVDANALTGGGGDSKEDTYNYFVSGSNANAFKATGFNTVAPDNASIADIKTTTDQFVFTVSNQVDANAITGGYPSGPGGSPTIVTVTSNGAPLENASVWVSTDVGGTNVIAGQLFTNVSGQVTFMLDSGSYYCWVQHNEVNFTNPTILTVS